MRFRVFLAATAVALLGLLTFATAAGASGSTRVFATFLTGAAERPGPGDPDGFGVAIVTVNPDRDLVCWLIAVRRITLPATLSHIHRAPSTASGPVVVDFMGAPNASGISFGCTTDVDADAIVLNPENHYVNVHTSDFPAGAVRGQLG